MNYKRKSLNRLQSLTKFKKIRIPKIQTKLAFRKLNDISQKWQAFVRFKGRESPKILPYQSESEQEKDAKTYRKEQQNGGHFGFG